MILVNLLLRFLRTRGDCSFVAEEAEALILWELAEAHQTGSVSEL